jgi:hypothetical protein
MRIGTAVALLAGLALAVPPVAARAWQTGLRSVNMTPAAGALGRRQKRMGELGFSRCPNGLSGAAPMESPGD